MIGRWKDLDEGTLARLLWFVACALVFGLALVATLRGCL